MQQREERGEEGRRERPRRGEEACALSNKRLVIARPLCEDDSSSAETEGERERTEGLLIKGRGRERGGEGKTMRAMAMSLAGERRRLDEEGGGGGCMSCDQERASSYDLCSNKCHRCR
jgi:hypothetical protein